MYICTRCAIRTIDEGSEIIKKVEFNTASHHDSGQFDKLVDYTEESVFADKGYSKKKENKIRATRYILWYFRERL